MAGTPNPQSGRTAGRSSSELASVLFEHALAAAERGWHVFPLAPGGNTPAVKGWQDRATIDRTRIERGWTPTTSNPGTWNIGIACGPSGLLVVDLDVAKDDTTGFCETGAEGLTHLAAEHGEVPDTYTVTTPSGGRHLYFTAPTEAPRRPASLEAFQRDDPVQMADPTSDAVGTVVGTYPESDSVAVQWDRVKNPIAYSPSVLRPFGQPLLEPVQLGNTVGRLHPEIDTRGIGGYVVGAGSRRPDGEYAPSPFRFDGDPYTIDPRPAKDTAMLPGWLVDQLRHLSDRSGGHERAGLPADEARRRAYIDKIVADELARILNSGADRHNESLFIASAHLGELVAAGHLDDTTLRAVLIAAGQHVGQPAKEARGTVESGFRNGAKNPRHIEPPHTARTADAVSVGVTDTDVGATRGAPAASPVAEADADDSGGDEHFDRNDIQAADVARFGEDERVRALYPLPDDDRDDRTSWHWLPAVVVEAIDDPRDGVEYLLLIDDERLAEPDAHGEPTYPLAYRDPTEVRPVFNLPDDDHEPPEVTDPTSTASQHRGDHAADHETGDGAGQGATEAPVNNTESREGSASFRVELAQALAWLEATDPDGYDHWDRAVENAYIAEDTATRDRLDRDLVDRWRNRNDDQLPDTVRFPAEVAQAKAWLTMTDHHRYTEWSHTHRLAYDQAEHDDDQQRLVNLWRDRSNQPTPTPLTSQADDSDEAALRRAREDRLDQAKTWFQHHDPTHYAQWNQRRAFADTIDDENTDDRDLIRNWLQRINQTHTPEHHRAQQTASDDAATDHPPAGEDIADRRRNQPAGPLAIGTAERITRSATPGPNTPTSEQDTERRAYVEAGARGLHATELATGDDEPNNAVLAQLGQLHGGGYLHPSTVYAATCRCRARGCEHEDTDILGADPDTGAGDVPTEDGTATGTSTDTADPSTESDRAGADSGDSGPVQRSSVVEKARLAVAEFAARLTTAEQRARARTRNRVDRVSDVGRGRDARGRGEALSW